MDKYTDKREEKHPREFLTFLIASKSFVSLVENKEPSNFFKQPLFEILHFSASWYIRSLHLQNKLHLKIVLLSDFFLLLKCLNLNWIYVDVRCHCASSDGYPSVAKTAVKIQNQNRKKKFAEMISVSIFFLCVCMGVWVCVILNQNYT